MKYVPWDSLEGRPNIIVDGYPADGTVLTLSHWRGSGSPDELAADLSTQIAFRYLDRPDLEVEAEAVSNNHFDEDGLCGIYAVLYPDEALAHRELIEDVAGAGDFEIYRDRNAARVAFTLKAYADPERSPLGDSVFALPYPQQAAALYEEGLPRLPEMLDDPGRFKDLWEAEDARLAIDEERVRSGAILIEERPDIDLAIVTVPEDMPDDGEDAQWSGGAHPAAIHTATGRHRVLLVKGNRYAVRYRYETWVRYVSRPTMPRVDLEPFAKTLTERESSGGRWEFDGVEDLTPSLHLEGSEGSSIDPEDFVSAVTEFLSA